MDLTYPNFSEKHVMSAKVEITATHIDGSYVKMEVTPPPGDEGGLRFLGSMNEQDFPDLPAAIHATRVLPSDTINGFRLEWQSHKGIRITFLEGVYPCPECEVGKHSNCTERSLDLITDEFKECPCSDRSHT